MLQSPPSSMGVGHNPLLSSPHGGAPMAHMFQGYPPPHPEFLAAAAAASSGGAGGGQPPHPFLPQNGLPHPSLLEPPKPRFMFRVPRVVPNQKQKFESDDLLKRHSREAEVRYTAFRDRPVQERQAKFIQSLREGHSEIAFIATGFNLMLSFNPHPSFDPRIPRQIDFDKEPGKVHVVSSFILNGVCVRWKGYLHLERLDGVGCLEFDEEFAKQEDILLKEQVEIYNRSMKEMEEQRKMQQRHLAALMGHRQAVMSAAMGQQDPNSSSQNEALTRLRGTSHQNPSPDSAQVPNLSSRGDLNSSFLLSDILNEKSPSSSQVSSTSPLGSEVSPHLNLSTSAHLSSSSDLVNNHPHPKHPQKCDLSASIVSSSDVPLDDVVDVCNDEDSL